jgi:crossover junction endodeoxyribonuclease RuvC
MRVLGVDLALRRTGWAVVEGTAAQSRLVARGVIVTTGDDHPTALHKIGAAITTIIREQKPTQVCVEEPGRMNKAYGRSKETTTTLAKALGVVLACCHALGVRVEEVPQSKAKGELTGNDYASKEAVHTALSYLALGGVLEGYTTPRRPKGGVDEDMDDAVAVALVGVRAAGPDTTQTGPHGRARSTTVRGRTR